MLEPGNRRHGGSPHLIVLLTLWNFLKGPKFTRFSLKNVNFWNTPRITDVRKQNDVSLPGGQAYAQICRSTKDTFIRSLMSLCGETPKIHIKQRIYQVGPTATHRVRLYSGSEPRFDYERLNPENRI